jgi:tetratricopeptide (TPR) repeat protein
MGEAIGWLEKALALDPTFARAHARLALIHILGQARYGASESEAERHAQLALALDPALAETQYVLGGVARRQRHWLDARAATDRALELAPNDASAHLYCAQLLIITGYTRQGIAHLEQALAIDPLLPNALFWRGRQYVFAGDLDAAERLFQRTADLGLSFANAGLAQVARARGDYAKARALTMPYLLQKGVGDCLKAPAVSLPIMLDGEIGGDATAVVKAQAVIDECLAARPTVVPLWVADFLLQIGQPKQALNVIEQGRTRDDAGLFMNFWGIWGKDARRLPEFAEFARKVGYADLWERYGAPDACRRAAPRDYTCE